MKCHYISGKIGENNQTFYLCTEHKQYETNEQHIQNECRYIEKDAFDSEKIWNKDEVHDLEFIFSLPYNSKNCEIWVNKEIKVSAFFIGNSKIIKDDFFGLYTSLKNHISLKVVKCSFCGHYHNDNEIFAVKPHDSHLCYYCGKLFPVEKANIGNELVAFFDIPPLKTKVVEKENGRYFYNILTGDIKSIEG